MLMLARRHGLWINLVRNLPAIDAVTAVDKKTLLTETLGTHQSCRAIRSTMLYCDSRDVKHPGLLPPSNCAFLVKRTIKKTHLPHNHSQEEEEEEEERIYSDEAGGPDLLDVTFDGDLGLPDTFRDIKCHVNSVRLDSVLSYGLHISRRNVEDLFFESKLLVNGERLVKKSKKLVAGDCVDVIIQRRDVTMDIRRVRILKVSTALSKKGRIPIYLRAWRSVVSIRVPDS